MLGSIPYKKIMSILVECMYVQEQDANMICKVMIHDHEYPN